ncbi:SdpI family protein [Microbacterium sp. ET2]|uniref:SdpI family protein n=1 Tax=Microbacterium albipurpureum TaxID=3050384 RepID=UPI00259CEC68|nr:SdpI family protein [Microbacterium sp. ET2 (Ac-2212)]WJL96739.1 SdpI family protein [Microbacterium sp. ET2 (Ac-2212)]
MTGPDAPQWALLITAVILVVAGILMVVLARRSRERRLPLNPIAGVRTTTTMASDAAWYAAQAAAAPRTEIAGWGTLVGGAAVGVAALLPLSESAGIPLYMVLVFGTVAWLLGWTLTGAAHGQRAARGAVEAGEGEAGG